MGYVIQARSIVNRKAINSLASLQTVVTQQHINDCKQQFETMPHIGPKPALALYQPDIAGNTGTLIRLSACLGTVLHIIEPAGFRTDDTHLKRAGMDYRDLALITRHIDYTAFKNHAQEFGSRVILFSTKAAQPYTEFQFTTNDILLMGRESSGVPDDVHQQADARLLIPMAEGARSLNQAVSASMVLGEALRQTGGFPQT